MIVKQWLSAFLFLELRQARKMMYVTEVNAQKTTHLCLANRWWDNITTLRQLINPLKVSNSSDFVEQP